MVALVLLLIFIILPPLPSTFIIPMVRALGQDGKVIVLDPGHGGSDSGAIGPSGLMEKDVNLDVSLRLRELLKPFFKVFMTRDSDVYVSLSDRVKMAEECKADIFISIHNNAFISPTAHGIETYYYTDMDDRSRRLASIIQQELIETLKRRDRGVKKGNYYVLRECYRRGITAVLVEILFISNPEEERMLRDPSIRQKAAEAIFNAVLKFYKFEGRSRRLLVGAWLGVYSDIYSSSLAEWRMQVDSALRKLKEAGVNTIFFLAKDPWGYVYYNSSYALRSLKYGWDCLEYVLRRSREYNLSIHVYINIFSEGETKVGYYLRQNPGRSMINLKGKEVGWACPMDEEVRERAIRILLEVIERYDVEGVQLDRIRFPDNTVCYCKRCIEEFRRIYGREPRGKDEDWVKFRQSLISSFVKEAYERIKAAKPKVKVSAAVFPRWESAARQQLQDWGRWVKEGWLDFIVPMAYTNLIDRFKLYVDDGVKTVGGKIPLYIGIGAYMLTPELLKKQIKLVKEKGLEGMVFFNVDTLITRPEMLKALASGLTEPTEKADDKVKQVFIIIPALITLAITVALGFIVKLRNEAEREETIHRKTPAFNIEKHSYHRFY